jgi:hypothetical protein
MNDPIEFWHVQLPDGSVSTMTLDDLDVAFQIGTVHEQTYVLKQGEATWATLATLLGLETPEPPPRAPAPVAKPMNASSFAPTDFMVASSLRPVVSDVDDDLDFDAPPFRSSKKRTLVKSVAAIAAVAAIVAAVGSGRVANFSSSRALATLGSIRAFFGSSSATVASQPPPSQPVAATPPAPPPVVEATPAPVPDRFDDSQKRALLEADKARASQQKAKMNAAPPRRSPGYKADGKAVFHKGGDKYDPLNSSL